MAQKSASPSTPAAASRSEEKQATEMDPTDINHVAGNPGVHSFQSHSTDDSISDSESAEKDAQYASGFFLQHPAFAMAAQGNVNPQSALLLLQ